MAYIRGLGDTDDDDSGWSDTISTIATDVSSIAKPILTARFGAPTAAPGTYYQVRNADGSTTTVYGQPTGSSALSIPGLTSTTGSSSLLLFGGAALLLVVLLKR